jgi:glycerol-3-phosphate acyltransferase PlsY
MPLAFIVWLHSLSIVVAAYLLGSIPTGYLLMRIFRKQDIRSLGSGNIGATNVLRSGAKGLGAATFLLDVLKGVLAVLVGARLGGMWTPAFHPHEAEALAALCAVLGHMFPIWLGLRGGKGVATAFGVFLVLVPYAALASLAVFVVVFALSRFVSLASILGAAAFPPFAWFTARWLATPWTHNRVVAGATIIVAILILIKHSQNIKRLLSGTEYRFGSGGKKAGAEASSDMTGPA